MEVHLRGYNFFKHILGFFFTIFYHPKFINKEFIPQNGGVIIATNHRHLLDQCLPILATKRMLHYLAKIEYFQGPYAWWFKLVGCIPVDRSRKDQKATSLAIELLNKNQVLGIFPEGTRNKSNDLLLNFKYGTVSLASKTNAYIVPSAITGTYHLFCNNLKITFGKPFKVGNMSLEEANKKLHNDILNIIRKENNNGKKKSANNKS